MVCPIPRAPMCCWNSPNIPPGTIPVALFVFQHCPPAIALKPSPLNSAKCDSHRWILHRPIKGRSSWVASAQISPKTYVQERGPSTLTVFHPKILFIRPVTRATLDHKQTLHTPWHHLRAISDPPLCHDITWDETLSKAVWIPALWCFMCFWIFIIIVTHQQLIAETRISATSNVNMCYSCRYCLYCIL